MDIERLNDGRHELTVDNTELQILHEAMQQARPFEELSPEIRDVSQDVRLSLRAAVEGLRENGT